VQDQEIKFGYAVTGSIDPSRVLTNGGAKPGDVLFLTKPLGTGIVGTAIKFDRADAALVEAVVGSMRTLNRAAAQALETLPAGSVHACTDVTGFGLIGHGTEIARASGVTLLIEGGKVPIFDGVLAIAARNQSGGLSSNEEHYSGGVTVQFAWPPQPDLPVPEKTITLMGRVPVLYDPQTSGGLLVAVAPHAAAALDDAMRSAGVAAARIGVVQAATPGVHIVVRP
jgi:selenide,water dikinase